MKQIQKTMWQSDSGVQYESQNQCIRDEIIYWMTMNNVFTKAEAEKIWNHKELIYDTLNDIERTINLKDRPSGSK